MTFGKRFKQLRIERGLKQQELIDDFNKIYGYNFSRPLISQYETDKKKPATNVLKDFASYFNVSIDYLLAADDSNDNCIEHEKKSFKDICTTAATAFFKDDSISREEKDKLFKEFSKLYFNSLK